MSLSTKGNTLRGRYSRSFDAYKVLKNSEKKHAALARGFGRRASLELADSLHGEKLWGLRDGQGAGNPFGTEI